MSSNPKKLKTFNPKKDKKLQAKKRKLEAFLNLVRKDEENHLAKKKAGGSLAENYKALKDELKKYQKKEDIGPSLYLTDCGRNASVNLTSNEKLVKCTSPIFVEDVYHLLLRSVLGHMSDFPVRFLKLDHPQFVSKTVLIEIEGLAQHDVFDIITVFKQECDVLPYVFEVVSSDIPFATELSTLHLASDFYNQAKENYASLFPMTNGATDQSSVMKVGKQNISRLHLLLSPIQLAMEAYPLPKSVFEQSDCTDYCFSKESYTPVNADSPLFALDCEMCRIISGKHEVTRIAIVNERLETVYHTLVKPKEHIVDYMTRYSGVTAEMLENVKTTLEDVHADIQRILPSDAILCGQSLNCDLRALRMIHPYIIDTSVIFNECGVRQKKTSLKQLARIHLKEVIQDNKKGHNPIEDAIASMRLVQLKLKNCVEYGDAVLCLGEDTNNGDDNCALVPAKVPKFSEYVKLNSGSGNVGFFTRISKFSKNVCVIGSEDSLSNYCTEMLADNVSIITKSTVKKIIKAISSNIESNNLIISHLVMDAKSSSVAEVNDALKHAYESFPNKTLFVVFISGLDKFKDENFKHSACMTFLKTVKTNI